MRPPGFVLAVSLVLLLAALSGCFHARSAAPGGAARDFLQGNPYSKLVVEIDFQASKPPADSAVELLKKTADERLNKPGGIQVEKTSFSTSESQWSAAKLRDLESSKRGRRTGGDTAALYVLYLGGSYAGDTADSKVLGVAFGPSSVAIFKDNIESAGLSLGPIPVFTTVDIERSVLVHEFGHILGLVNLGTPMVKNHEDPDPKHAGHSSNKGSVMYWAIESNAISRAFGNTPPTEFDADDKADLKAAGGK